MPGGDSMSRHSRIDDDRGTSLVELLVAMGIFLVVMAVVTTVAISGLRTVTTATAVSDIQVAQQNALLWTTRLLRYADNPVEGLNPTPWVDYDSASNAEGASAVTFYTYSGTGPLDGVPYRVVLELDAAGDLVTEVSTPQKPTESYEGWCWTPDTGDCSTITEDTARRVLVAASDGHTPGLTLTYRDEGGTVLEVPGAGGSVDAWNDWASQVDTVDIRIFDTETPASEVSQLVKLENPR